MEWFVSTPFFLEFHFSGRGVDCCIGVDSCELGGDTVDGSPLPAKPPLMGISIYIYIIIISYQYDYCI